MKRLAQLHLVQYSFWDYETFNFRSEGTAFLGPNGAGKTSLMDAIQVGILGAHGQQMHFNSQSIHKDRRTLRDYALGMMRSGEGEKGVLSRKRDESLSYITMVFEGAKPADVVSCGLCIHALATEKAHRVLGLYVLPGVRITLQDHLGALEGGGLAPLDWTTFDALARRLAKEAGRTPTITAKPETYQEELLHVLAPRGRAIDRNKLLRSLLQSLRLKNVSSVDDYLRGYLVDAQPIDKQGTLRHIKTVRALVKQIQDVGEQIAALEDVDRRFNAVTSLCRGRAASRAARLQLDLEATDEKVAWLMLSTERLNKQIGELEQAQSLKQLEAQELRQAHNRLLGQFNADPAAQVPAQAQQLKDALASALTGKRESLDRMVLLLRQTLADTPSALPQASPICAGLLAHSQRWEEAAQQGSYLSTHDLKATLDLLANVWPAAGTQLIEDRKNKEDCETRLRAVAEKVRAASQGIRLDTDGDVAIAMGQFREHGIESQPVASLVAVTDSSWQAAIETFLGRNRFALVVAAGRENDAVRILRQARRPLYEVTVVQPWHLRDAIGRRTEPETVAELLTGKNETALAFLRRILGRMKCVETEEELRQNERALTKDGMLSANGGTRRLRLEPASSWVLGIDVSEQEKQTLRTQLIDRTADLTNATARLAASEQAYHQLRQCLDQVTLPAYDKALATFRAALGEHDVAKSRTEEPLPEHLKLLKDRLEQAEAAANAAAGALPALAGQIKEAENTLSTDLNLLRDANARLSSLQAAHLEAMSDPDFDADAAASAYARAAGFIREGGEDLPTVLGKFAREESLAETRIASAEATARGEFVQFINRNSINLVEERSDWRIAAVWTQRQVTKLRDSTLRDYERDAEAARDAANRSFRADVAFRMREAIMRMNADIDDLNRILGTCPEFTNSERYRFSAEPALAHKDIHDLIIASAGMDRGELPLEQPGATQQKLVQFLEDCEQGIEADNPLEDYRLLFKFDLDILVNGVAVDKLSQRLGVGSNGEHLVPFYVIAGASLANAYRIKVGEEHDGFALMLTDEAFHGFDEQNTFVTAQFLVALGLQPVFAAPDSDRGKLAPVLGSLYDLYRVGPDVFAEEDIIKEEARSLMISDMPMQHPDLVDQLAEQLTAAA